MDYSKKAQHIFIADLASVVGDKDKIENKTTFAELFSPDIGEKDMRAGTLYLFVDGIYISLGYAKTSYHLLPLPLIPRIDKEVKINIIVRYLLDKDLKEHYSEVLTELDKQGAWTEYEEKYGFSDIMAAIVWEYIYMENKFRTFRRDILHDLWGRNDRCFDPRTSGYFNTLLKVYFQGEASYKEEERELTVIY